MNNNSNTCVSIPPKITLVKKELTYDNLSVHFIIKRAMQTLISFPTSKRSQKIFHYIQLCYLFCNEQLQYF